MSRKYILTNTVKDDHYDDNNNNYNNNGFIHKEAKKGAKNIRK
jgi:hypothetical protein